MTISRVLKRFIGLLIVLWSFSVNAGAIDVNIVSDGSWRSNEVFFAGWETSGFDDSAWAFARAPYPSAPDVADLIPGTAGFPIWHDPEAEFDGTNGPIRAFFRRIFNLTIDANSLPLIGQALINVDDDFEFYVNGNLVFENKDNGFADVVDFVDFSRFLVNGENVFAIHAVDGGWNNPRDRIFERFLIDATISTISVPAPATHILLGFGLAGLGFAGGRLRRIQSS